MPRLTEEALHAALTTLPGWQVWEGKLIRSFNFPTFAAAITFVNQVADLAESVNHHPDIDIRYTKLRLALISHDTGGITIRDVRFATTINTRFPPQL